MRSRNHFGIILGILVMCALALIALTHRPAVATNGLLGVTETETPTGTVVTVTSTATIFTSTPTATGTMATLTPTVTNTPGTVTVTSTPPQQRTPGASLTPSQTPTTVLLPITGDKTPAAPNANALDLILIVLALAAIIASAKMSQTDSH